MGIKRLKPLLEIRDKRQDDKQDVWSASERQDGKRVAEEGLVLANNLLLLNYSTVKIAFYD